jgi:hypothetical protein
MKQHQLKYLTDKQIQVLFNYLQDPEGTGSDSTMSNFLTEHKLWNAYSNLMRKIYKLYEQLPKEKQL